MSDEILQEVASLLFGDGASELVAKLSSPRTEEEKDRRARGITAGLSAIGGTAGAAGLGYAAHKMGGAYRKAPKALGRVGRLKAAVGNEKLGAALIPLEVAGLGGELMATKILHGDTKKKVVRFDPVKKSEPSSPDLHAPGVRAGSARRVPRSMRAAKLKALSAAEIQTRKKAPTLTRKALASLNQTPAMGNKVEQYGTKKTVSKSMTWEGEISKVDEDKRQVFGWASIVEMNGEPVVDLQGDYIDIDEIEKSAYDYVIKSRKGGEMHRRDGEAPVHVSDMIESFLVTPEKKEKLGLPDSMPTGWWVGYQINDDEAWNLVKSGKRTGFSIHGRGQRTPSEI